MRCIALICCPFSSSQASFPRWVGDIAVSGYASISEHTAQHSYLEHQRTFRTWHQRSASVGMWDASATDAAPAPPVAGEQSTRSAGAACSRAWQQAASPLSVPGVDKALYQGTHGKQATSQP